MSSPTATPPRVSMPEGKRVVLQEITASSFNPPQMQFARFRKSGLDCHGKSGEHEVKVRFAREFAEVGSTTYSAPESLSSASSFHSLSSTLSIKSSSGICPDSVPASPNDTANLSYVNGSIPGLDDLVAACADIQLNSDGDVSFAAQDISRDISQDQTFASATDEPQNELFDEEDQLPLDPADVTQVILNKTVEKEFNHSNSERVVDVQERPILGTICIRDSFSVASDVANKENIPYVQEAKIDSEVILSDTTSAFDTCVSEFGLDQNLLPESGKDLNSTVCLSSNKSLDVLQSEKESAVESGIEEANGNVQVSSPSNLLLNSTTSFVLPTLSLVENIECPTLPSISTLPSFSSTADTSELKPSELKPTELKPTELKATELKPTELKLTELKLTELKPTDQISTSEDIEVSIGKSSSPLNNVSVKLDSTTAENLASSFTHETESSINTVPEVLAPSVCNIQNTEEETCSKLLSDASVAIAQSIDILHQKQEILTNSSQLKCSKTEDSVEKEIQSPIVQDSIKSPKVTVEENVQINVTPFIHESEFLNLTVDLETLEDSIEDEEEVKESKTEKLDRTLTLENTSLSLETAPEVVQYTEFKPQRQSTTLALPKPEPSIEDLTSLAEDLEFLPQKQSTEIALPKSEPSFEDLQSVADEIANDIYKTAFDLPEENDNFISATSEIFQDPTSFDYLLARSNSRSTTSRLTRESLFVKFDPLVGNTSMLPKGNAETINEEQNGKNESPVASVGTPKRNPAIAAIDKLLFYSPIPSGTIQKTEETKEKISAEESKREAVPDINMCKELELVRTTVLQLEEKFEKQKKEYEAELERQKNVFQEKINKLQTQIAQEMSSKSEMAVVVEEYEKSISRLHTQREKDRTCFEQEKAKLQEELQATNSHLTNTEAAFNDVHQKYERLKGVVAAYRSNETVLKESIQENIQTIKGLETRYEQLKNHATEQLNMANLELDAIRKQHKDETVKRDALLRKAELKSNSLAQMVEQKTKENKELAQILDEVIARVGHKNSE